MRDSRYPVASAVRQPAWWAGATPPVRIKTDMLELANIPADSASPAGRKSLVVAESAAGPGTIDTLWFAANDSVATRTIGHGADLIGTDVDLALKVQGTTTAVFWRLTGAPDWSSLAEWTTGKTGSALSIGTWTGGARFTNLLVQNLS